eukprot:TRINITY_DN71708_c0_g1_i1.p2 TRINITY_DN71708_c0_g1~~TRINITY_DN71708_c0_g1_i1.p2  ORF type:complete len:154 (+),score=11.34 TRINITY_DN71708_c0_g1_i1:234-695(+)
MHSTEAGKRKLAAIPLAICSVLHIVIGAFFWQWALKNMMKKKPPVDSGIVLFLIIIAAGFIGIANSARLLMPPSAEAFSERSRCSLARAHEVLVLIGHGLLTLAFTGYIFLWRDDAWKRNFGIINAVSWSVTGAVFYCLLRFLKVRQMLDRAS